MITEHRVIQGPKKRLMIKIEADDDEILPEGEHLVWVTDLMVEAQRHQGDELPHLLPMCGDMETC